jgi:four helix bundle protein
MKPHFRFEKLNVWQNSRRLSHDVYQITRGFPKFELFGMTSQIRRAVVSISSNIAEGSGRNSDRDFAHFLEQAYGSGMETASLLYLALDEAYLGPQDTETVLMQIESLVKGIASLNRSLGIADSKTPFSRNRD